MFPSPYFKREEIACSCGCGFDTFDAELLAVLNDLHFHFGQRVFITRNGGNRCCWQNGKSGGAKDSQHLHGKASDVKVEFVDPSDVYAYLDSKYPGQYGIGRYKTFTHIDVRSKKARW